MRSKQYKLLITSEAQVEIDDEIEYSKQNWGNKHALEYLRKIKKLMNGIETR